MQALLWLALAGLCVRAADYTDRDTGECVIELECEECLPEHMPAVTAPAARGGAVRLPAGGELALSCGAGHFQLYARAALAARCEAGRWRVAADGALRPLLELGCQQDVLEDVRHAVPHCAPPLHGRAYETRAEPATRHLALLCYDAERALAVHAHAAGGARDVPLAAHSDARAPLSILGNFDQMFDASARRDAERLYGDVARLNRRLRELVRPERAALAGQELAPARLLAPAYFAPQHARAAEFASNKALSWRSVVEGNWRHLQADVAALLARERGAHVVAGTHGALARGAGEAGTLALGAGGRFPVPRYLWTAVLLPARGAGVALVLLNDPFVPVSEVRAAVFCDSACSRLPWLAELTRRRHYERPLLGLVFCCRLPEFARTVTEMPRVFNDTVQLLE